MPGLAQCCGARVSGAAPCRVMGLWRGGVELNPPFGEKEAHLEMDVRALHFPRLAISSDSPQLPPFASLCVCVWRGGEGRGCSLSDPRFFLFSSKR